MLLLGESKPSHHEHESWLTLPFPLLSMEGLCHSPHESRRTPHPRCERGCRPSKPCVPESVCLELCWCIPRAGGKCRCFPGWIGCGLSAQRPLAHVLILGPVPRDLDLVGSHLVVDVVNHQCDHNDEAQDEPQNQRQGFLQLLPLIHWAFML